MDAAVSEVAEVVTKTVEETSLAEVAMLTMMTLQETRRCSRTRIGKWFLMTTFSEHNKTSSLQ